MFKFKGFLYFPRPELKDGGGHLIDQLGKLFSFTGADPFQFQPLFFYAHLAYELLKEFEPPEAFIIPFLVMAIPRMTSTYKNTIGTLLKGFEDESGFYPSRRAPKKLFWRSPYC